jgi:hypothetical protein
MNIGSSRAVIGLRRAAHARRCAAFYRKLVHSAMKLDTFPSSAITLAGNHESFCR